MSRRLNVKNGPVPYAGAVTLIKTKDALRPKDKQDVLFLREKLRNV